MGEKITIGKAKTFNEPGTKNFSYLHTVVKDNLSKFFTEVNLCAIRSILSLFFSTSMPTLISLSIMAEKMKE